MIKTLKKDVKLPGDPECSITINKGSKVHVMSKGRNLAQIRLSILGKLVDVYVQSECI